MVSAIALFKSLDSYKRDDMDVQNEMVDMGLSWGTVCKIKSWDEAADKKLI